MRFVFSGTIRRALVTLVLTAVLPALGIILYSGIEARKQALRDAENSALLMAQGIAELQERTTRDIQLLFQVLTKTPLILQNQGSESTELFRELVRDNPELANIAVADLDGNLLASAVAYEKVNVSGRKHFQEVLRSGSFTVGEYQVSMTTGQPVFPFASPLRGPGGRTVGVLLASIPLGPISKLFQNAYLPPDSVVSVADRNGSRLHRSPASEKILLGQPIPAAIWEAMTRPDSPDFAHLEGADGVRRIYAFARLRLSPEDAPYLYISVGIPESHGLAVANALLLRNLWLLAAASVLALAISWLLGKLMLVRRIDRLVAVTETVGAGGLSARIGSTSPLGELGRLERSVDRMADALAKDAEERKRYERELREANDELEQRVLNRTRELRDANTMLKKEIRKRTRAQKALRQSEEMHRALYEQSAVGIFVMDLQGTVLDANPTALELLGYTIEEIKGKPYRNLILPENLDSQPIDTEKILSGNVVRAERVYLTKDGRGVPVDVSGRIVTPDTYQAVFKDATERKKLEQLREDVERITRHDLKTPLLGIVHIPAMLLKHENLTEKQRELLRMMQASGYRMLRNINMSLALYKIESKTYQCEQTPFDMLGTMTRVVEETSAFAGSRGVSGALMLDGAAPLPDARFTVDGEEHLCVTMLENLVKNALEASPKGAEVRLEFDSARRTLSIRNLGEVPQGIRARFFEKYTTEGKKWGTGLGTYSARLIAEAHGWTIRLDDSVPGETTIVIGFAAP
ncbi:PAS domain S-box protein [Fundidesulfovibrio terrae]|uniref:PAS domain S-box protein n=1 Tax=Fundidesulfovibrio terrae TaxID=2922866 RepID=UPI001FAFA6AD|nr:PAS domain S-box protein [Fundidesulfovibrio terrae]